ncbi:MAG: glycosyltransferase [Ignavibacteria bacterium]|nr:glycosyltransferase [Ignavibacteria bacterium]
MKYSIIIPTLNEEKLLPQLLNQLADKDLKKKYDYEIIISDGKSTDNTVSIAKISADKVIIHNGIERQNIAAGRNRGSEVAEGDILIFFNGDILISKPTEFFERIDFVFNSQKNVAMTCKIEVFPDEARFWDYVFQNFYNMYFYLLNKIGIGMGRGECQIIRKNIFFKFNQYNENLAAGEDFDLFKRIKKKHDIYFDFKTKVFESPRRYRKYGHFNILFKWLFNAIFVMLLKKSLSKEWEPVR